VITFDVIDGRELIALAISRQGSGRKMDVTVGGTPSPPITKGTN